uniref:Uncharacterized protein n=1 Tax=Haptolina ericina TaxID=156174 RepID=A0A7S3BUH8_9EUKA|mmetsp:Transcript_6680/g.14921  ORF Transcript_6680/g.14921 Transcript_6680/m.14921 type:complete len:269 (+) Transcript_6680:669-1475(+)
MDQIRWELVCPLPPSIAQRAPRDLVLPTTPPPPACKDPKRRAVVTHKREGCRRPRNFGNLSSSAGQRMLRLCPGASCCRLTSANATTAFAMSPRSNRSNFHPVVTNVYGVLAMLPLRPAHQLSLERRTFWMSPPARTVNQSGAFMRLHGACSTLNRSLPIPAAINPHQSLRVLLQSMGIGTPILIRANHQRLQPRPLSLLLLLPRRLLLPTLHCQMASVCSTVQGKFCTLSIGRCSVLRRLHRPCDERVLHPCVDPTASSILCTVEHD